MISEPLRQPLESARGAPPILEHAGPLLARYDAVFCDVWGVLHDGFRAFARAGAALARFRADGGTVILVSNAPASSGSVASMLDFTGVRREAWDAIVTSGDIAVMHLAKEGYRRLFCIGPPDRDRALFDSLDAEFVPLEAAEAILCTGLNDDRAERAQSYGPLLERALGLGLPLVCANPDLVVDIGGTLYPCAGAVADIYERMGGRVFWAGKPHANAFATAHALAERLRGTEVGRSRILAVGDAIRTDIAAAQTAGVDAILVLSGIHREEVMAGGRVSPERLARLFAPPAPAAIGVMRELTW